jgi:hypothetical protein
MAHNNPFTAQVEESSVPNPYFARAPTAANIGLSVHFITDMHNVAQILANLSIGSSVAVRHEALGMPKRQPRARRRVECVPSARALAKIPSTMSRVRRPVKVFCWLGW